MDCLRSFSFSVDGQSNFVPPDVKTWLAGAQEYWTFQRALTSSYIVRGFKNIDVYGVKVVGGVTTLKTAALGGAITEDWFVSVKLNGQLPLLGGTAGVPNDWSITTDGPLSSTYEVSKFNSSFMLESPIKSVIDISLTNFKAIGFGGQTALNINLAYNFNFIIYYKFEGE
jgi:hypothetical protein